MIVIGGGVQGLLLALEAKAQSRQEVTVVDPFLPNRLSEKGSRHLNTWWERPKGEVQGHGVKLWDNLTQQIQLPIFKTACLRFLEESEIQEVAEGNRENGQEVIMLSPNEMKERYGIFHTIEGMLLPGLSRMMDMRATHKILRQHLIDQGVTFINMAATELKVQNDRCYVQLADSSSIDSDFVAVCNGVWTRKLLKPYFNLNFRVTQQQYTSFRHRKIDTSAANNWPLVEDDTGVDGGYYTKPTTGEVPLIIAYENYGPEVTPDGENLPFSEGEIAQVCRYAEERYGGELEMLQTTACRYSLLPDMGIIADFVPGTENRVLMAQDFGAGGCKVAPSLADVIMRYVTGQKQVIDVSTFTVAHSLTLDPNYTVH